MTAVPATPAPVALTEILKDPVPTGFMPVTVARPAAFVTTVKLWVPFMNVALGPKEGVENVTAIPAIGKSFLSRTSTTG